MAMEIKRSRPAKATQSSSFSPKMGSLAASLIQTTAVKAPTFSFASKSNENKESPFALVAGKCQLSGSQLESYLRAEVQYLKRRKLIPTSSQSPELSSGSSSVAAYRGASSSTSHSDVDSDGEHTDEMKQKAGLDLPSNNDSLFEKPQFSLKQVKLICERLLKEQEIRLQAEYETALNKKLEEQHEQYVQFAKEQIAAVTVKQITFTCRECMAWLASSIVQSSKNQ
uniref:Akirin n=1 Tax=Ditylenchus dipsaci TaxID=166011 RepID=A0A915DCL6_9BILA